MSREARAESRTLRRNGQGPPSGRRSAGLRRELYRLFNNTTDGVVAVDLEGRVALWTQAAERLLGYTESEVLGRPCHEVIQGRDEHGNPFCQAHCHVLAMARRDEPADAGDAWACGKGGAKCWLNVTTILAPDGEGMLVVHLLRDVASARIQQRAVELLARQFSEPVASSSLVDGELPVALTRRQREILALLALGESNSAIARQLFISTATVRGHTRNILTKLGVHSRLAAVACALKWGPTPIL